jgi:hypothetical protein
MTEHGVSQMGETVGGRHRDHESRRNVAPGRIGKGKGLGGLRDEGTEVARLVIDYIKQETLDPVKGLGRYVLFGVAGSIALSIGLAIVAVGFLRLLQVETGSTFTGNLSWIPYLICAVVVVAVAAVAVWAISRGQTPSPAAGTEKEKS